MTDSVLRFAHKILQVQQVARKLFVIVFLVWASVFCLSSCAQDAPGTPAGKRPSAAVPEEFVREGPRAEPMDPQAESAGDEERNQDGGQLVPFSGSFENSEFGRVTVRGRLVISNEAGERTLEITEAKWDSGIFAEQAEQITKLKKSMLILVLVLAALAIAGLALEILSFVFGAKKEQLAELNAYIRSMEEGHAERYKELMELKGGGLKAAQPERGEYSASRADVRNIETRIDAIETRIDVLERNLRGFADTKDVNALSRRVDVLEADKRTREDIKKGACDSLEVFNSWAANPAFSPLPEAFYYLQGDFRIRELHTLKESANSSKWIINRYGEEKYLLPNPNFFDSMTNISELYKMDRTQLKAKGQNRIQITKPCKMGNGGFITYPGELQLL